MKSVPLLRQWFPPIGDEECNLSLATCFIREPKSLPLFSVNLGVFEGNFRLQGKAECIETVLTAAVVHEIC